MKHLNIAVYGVVQGVFFRASTKQEADRLGVHGFVRNEPDGSVYIEAEATEAVLEQFVTWCKHGPPRARVDECVVLEGELREYDRFEVRR